MSDTGGDGGGRIALNPSSQQRLASTAAGPVEPRLASLGIVEDLDMEDDYYNDDDEDYDDMLEPVVVSAVVANTAPPPPVTTTKRDAVVVSAPPGPGAVVVGAVPASHSFDEPTLDDDEEDDGDEDDGDNNEDDLLTPVSVSVVSPRVVMAMSSSSGGTTGGSSSSAMTPTGGVSKARVAGAAPRAVSPGIVAISGAGTVSPKERAGQNAAVVLPVREPSERSLDIPTTTSSTSTTTTTTPSLSGKARLAKRAVSPGVMSVSGHSPSEAAISGGGAGEGGTVVSAKERNAQSTAVIAPVKEPSERSLDSPPTTTTTPSFSEKARLAKRAVSPGVMSVSGNSPEAAEITTKKKGRMGTSMMSSPPQLVSEPSDRSVDDAVTALPDKRRDSTEPPRHDTPGVISVGAGGSSTSTPKRDQVLVTARSPSESSMGSNTPPSSGGGGGKVRPPGGRVDAPGVTSVAGGGDGRLGGTSHNKLFSAGTTTTTMSGSANVSPTNQQEQVIMDARNPSICSATSTTTSPTTDEIDKSRSLDMPPPSSNKKTVARRQGNKGEEEGEKESTSSARTEGVSSRASMSPRYDMAPIQAVLAPTSNASAREDDTRSEQIISRNSATASEMQPIQAFLPGANNQQGMSVPGHDAPQITTSAPPSASQQQFVSMSSSPAFNAKMSAANGLASPPTQQANVVVPPGGSGSGNGGGGYYATTGGVGVEMPVDPQQQQDFDPFAPPGGEKKGSFRDRCPLLGKRRMIIPFAILIVVAVIVISLAIVLTGGDGDGGNDPVGVSRVEETAMALVGVTPPDVLLREGTPQNQALRWIADVDTRKVSLDDASFVQRYILAVLYYSSTGEFWADQFHFLSGDDECRWRGEYDPENLLLDGVTCTNGKVTKLRLVNNLLDGEIPPELGELTGLDYLALRDNNLGGTLPSSVIQLTALSLLTLTHNLIGGTIGDNIGDLKRLEFLDLSVNLFDGTIPESLGNLTNVKTIKLHSNRLQGTVPQTVRNLKKLETFDLVTNELTGDITFICESGKTNVTADCLELECCCCSNCEVGLCQSQQTNQGSGPLSRSLLD